MEEMDDLQAMMHGDEPVEICGYAVFRHVTIVIVAASDMFVVLRSDGNDRFNPVNNDQDAGYLLARALQDVVFETAAFEVV